MSTTAARLAPAARATAQLSQVQRTPARLQQRIAQLPWPALEADLTANGAAVLPALLSRSECADLVESYRHPRLFRSRVNMAQHGFGRGEYQYFSYPLPPLVQPLRHALYAPLAAIANRWQQALGREVFPLTLAQFIERCHAAGQTRPTPLLLRYGAGDYNCLHQDLYGEHVFALQLTVLLSCPQTDFSGGEFVLTEQRPRAQSRVEVIPLAQGDAVVFAVRERAAAGQRGVRRVTLRHGVSRVREGQRYTLGLVFHDAA